MTLYMLNKVNFPLTNAQLSGFFQEKGYTTYIGFQQVLTELEETQLISYETIRNTYYYKVYSYYIIYLQNNIQESFYISYTSAFFG